MADFNGDDLKQTLHVEGSHVEAYLGKLEKWRLEVDGVYEFVMDRLNRKARAKNSAALWTDMAQVDIINTAVDAVHDYAAMKYAVEVKK